MEQSNILIEQSRCSEPVSGKQHAIDINMLANYNFYDVYWFLQLQLVSYNNFILSLPKYYALSVSLPLHATASSLLHAIARSLLHAWCC